MACIFVYDKKGVLTSEDLKAIHGGKSIKDKSYIANKSLTALKYDLLSESGQLSEDDGLTFYDAREPLRDTYSKLIEEADKTASSSKNKGESISRILHKEFPDMYSAPTTDFSEFIQRFATSLGDYVHAAISAYFAENFSRQIVLGSEIKRLSFNEAVADYINFLNNSRLELKKISPEEYSQAQKVLSPILNNNTEEDILEGLKKAAETFKAHVGNRKVYFEIAIIADSLVGKINGRLDSVIIDEEGNIEVVDFKTTSNRSIVNGQTNKYHLSQLSFYKELLSTLGVNRGRITLNRATISSNDLLGLPGIINMGSIKDPLREGVSNNRETAYKMRANVRGVVTKYFPQTKSNRTSSEVTTLVDKFKKLRKTLFDESALNRDDIDFLKKLVQNLKSHLKLRTALFGNCEVTISGDNITLIDRDEGRHTLPLEEFYKKEIKTRISNLENEYEVYLDALEVFTTEGDITAIQNILSNPAAQIKLIRAFQKYGDGLWEIVRDPVFVKLGIVVLRNLSNGSYDFMKLTAHNKLDQMFNFLLDEKRSLNLLGELIPDRILRKYPDANLASNLLNIYLLLTLLAIGLNQDQFKTDSNDEVVIGNITSLSMYTGVSAPTINYGEYLNLLQIIKAVDSKKEYSIPEIDSFNNAFSGLQKCRYLDFQTRLLDTASGIFSRLSTTDLQLALSMDPSKVKTLLSDAINVKTSLEEKIRICRDLCDQIKLNYPRLFNEKKFDQRTGDNEILHLYQVLQMVIATYEGLASDKNFMVGKMGFSFNDSIKLAYKILKHGNPDTFDGGGIMISGLAQGLYTASPYASPDDTIRRIVQYYTNATTQILHEAEPLIEDQNRATSEWLATKESLGATLIWSRHRPYYQLLFEKDSNGKVSKDFRFINPFIANSLTEADNTYLKHTLWNMYRISSLNDTTFTDDLKRLGYNELSKNKDLHTKFINLIKDNVSLRNVPLHTASNKRLFWEGLGTLVTGNKEERLAYWKKRIDKAKYWWDPRGLDELQALQMEDRIATLEAYNMYEQARSSEEERDRLLEAGPESYEWNVNAVINDFIFSYVTIGVNRKVLEKTDRAIWVLNFVEDLTGRNMSNLKDTLMKQTRVSLYNANNVEKDYKDLSTVTGLARSALNVGVIALRPTLMAKELIVGRAKNHMYTALGYFGDHMFTEAEMVKAECIVFGEGVFADRFKKWAGQIRPGDRSKVEAINWLFRIANMDANVVALRTLADRFGLLLAGLDSLYYTNIRPDWYNRCSIFVAKMIHDGIWEAYSLDENNHLVYHFDKDPRFSTFWKNRNKSGMEKNELFLKEKALYLYMMQLFSTEGIKNKEGKPLRYGLLDENYNPITSDNLTPYYDELPIAYTELEVNSLKETTGELYGYYNHEEKNAYLTGTYANLHMSFKTYLSGEVKHWFALNNGKTSKGKITHVTDAEGNPLYIEFDDFGNKTYTTSKTDKNGNYLMPYLDFRGIPNEGLLISLGKTLHDIWSEEGRKKLKDPKYKYLIVNTKICLLRFLIGGLIGLLVGLLLKKNVTKKDNAELYTALRIVLKATNDLSFSNSVLGTIEDFNLVGYDYLKELSSDTLNVLTGSDYTLKKAIYNNLLAFKDIPITV